MINKTSFVSIMNILDEYFNGEMAEARDTLGIGECRTTDLMDELITSIADDVDPKRLAEQDELTKFCGCYICEYLFGNGEFQETCSTAEKLYDYIAEKYIEKTEA
jgi:hypothetical protein